MRAIFIALFCHLFALSEGHSATTAPVKKCPSAANLQQMVDGFKTTFYCEGLFVAREEVTFKDSEQVAKSKIFEQGVLREMKFFSTSGALGTWLRFEYIGPNHWIKEVLELEQEDFGQPQKREEIINYNPESDLQMNSIVVREWFFSSKPLFHATHADRYENGVRSRPVGKEIYSIDGELLSTIRFEYQSAQSEKPFAFREYKDGELIQSYQLYTPFEPQKTWREHQLSASDVARRQENQKRSDRFLLAIIDSGFDYNHIELAHQWWNNPLEKSDGIDNDGNGWVDDIFGWDQVSDSGLPSESSTNLARDYRPLSHGTHVAHIATRDLWGAGLIGFAGDYTQASYIHKISAFLKKHEVKIVNMSLGLPSDIRDIMGLRDAARAYQKMVVDNPQTLFIFASGNASSDIDLYRNRQYPASIRAPNVLTVGALDTDHYDPELLATYKMAWFSNYGAKGVDILAPGTDVLAASIGGGLIKHSGTSMASPYMVNLAARLWMEFPELAASDVREIFLASAYPIEPRPPVVSGGFAHLARARELARDRVLELRLKKVSGRQSTLSGPNCWNSALYLSSMTGGIHHTSGEEFRALLESPWCQQVSTPRRGDIVALRRANAKGNILRGAMFSEIHGYTYLTSERGLSKNGTSVAVAYQELSHEEITEFYRRSQQQDCRIMGIPKEHCQMVQEYYRCRAPEQVGMLGDFTQKVLAAERVLERNYLANASDQLKPQIHAAVDQLQRELATLVSELSAAEELKQAELLQLRLESMRVTLF